MDELRGLAGDQVEHNAGEVCPACGGEAWILFPYPLAYRFSCLLCEYESNVNFGDRIGQS